MAEILDWWVWNICLLIWAHDLYLPSEIQIYADAVIGYPTQRFAKLMSENSRAPVYNYQFVYQGRYSFAVWSETKKPYGKTNSSDKLFNQDSYTTF